ncbi:MAG: glycine cleavage system aminomethyltransferase GcvT [Desulfovibrio sp.]
MTDLRKTPLTAWHHENGAKMAPFAGFDMPVQYEGIMVEHKHTRSAAGVFDISHMGEFILKGAGAKDALNKIITQDLETLAPGKCRYGFMPNEDGGVLDDLIIYCLGEDEYMLVVNGACEESDFNWVKSHLPEGLTFENVSDETAKIDLQGPQSFEVLEAVTGKSWNHIKYFNYETVEFEGEEMMVSRTGYTGELGVEFYLPASKALSLWEKLIADERVKPVGLGARDTLRLECGLPLYGQDLDVDHNPKECGFGWLLKKESDFIGKAGFDTIKEKLIGLTISGRRTARHNDKVLDMDGNEVGIVTSGSFGPTLGYCVAFAYVKADAADAETFKVKTARVELEATKADAPFYKEGTARKKLD